MPDSKTNPSAFLSEFLAAFTERHANPINVNVLKKELAVILEEKIEADVRDAYASASTEFLIKTLKLL